MQELRYLAKFNAVLVLAASLLMFSLAPAAAAAGHSTLTATGGNLTFTVRFSEYEPETEKPKAEQGPYTPFPCMPHAIDGVTQRTDPCTGGNIWPGTGGNMWPGTGGNMWPGTGGNMWPGTGGNMWPGTGGNLTTTGSNILYQTGSSDDSSDTESERPNTGDNSPFPCVPVDEMFGGTDSSLPPEQPKGESSPDSDGQSSGERRTDEEIQ